MVESAHILPAAAFFNLSDGLCARSGNEIRIIILSQTNHVRPPICTRNGNNLTSVRPYSFQTASITIRPPYPRFTSQIPTASNTLKAV
ncbi:hypothetical protein HMPREF9120_00951 [Neisseria sp. oral taxon 020 str. F0370]|nr:hypothetical protein HMPREF9120_00951 [Neisseria sp. oral taxon 020 str. F0370]